ncbi:MAG TPA: hypothetical protein GX700_14945 [Paracoccus sp.]|nr:hypothetical protein [Paracoccus sp. (in: a-proteobacteria)]
MSRILHDLRKLLQTLDAEHAAIRRSDLSRIGSPGARVQKVLDRLEGMTGALPREAEPLARRIVEQASRNRKLIAAALEGMRDARDLVARARLPRGLETYARDGMRQQIGAAPGQLEKRS